MTLIQLADDEQRLIRFLRCLPPKTRHEVLVEVGQKAMEGCLPDTSVCELMPMAGGVEPEKDVGNLHTLAGRGLIIEILHDGIQATGEPNETLLGSSEWDEDETFPDFATGATQTAHEQGSGYKYDVNFARKYIPAWRWEIVRACERAAQR